MNSDMRMRRPLRKQASLLDQSGCCSSSTCGQWRSVRMEKMAMRPRPTEWCAGCAWWACNKHLGAAAIYASRLGAHIAIRCWAACCMLHAGSWWWSGRCCNGRLVVPEVKRTCRPLMASAKKEPIAAAESRAAATAKFGSPSSGCGACVRGCKVRYHQLETCESTRSSRVSRENVRVSAALSVTRAPFLERMRILSATQLRPHDTCGALP